MSGQSDTRSRFKTRWHDRRPKYWLRKDPPRPEGFRAVPEIVRFEPAPGATRSGRPPVRIFLGTEPLQARAERVFLWSVQKHRDPARAYEVHLMRDLEGFDRGGWTTGFTNYRFAIPALAGGAGRAIYNDVDQVYLADPAGLFDLDMGDAAVLCVDEGETSVALIDCARMAEHWRLDDAQTQSRRRGFLEPLKRPGVWAALPPEWNARDDEYAPGASKCFHFTTLRLQPWRPFPEVMRYRDHPNAEVWTALEAEANAARFNGFSRARPSAAFAATSEADAAEIRLRSDEATARRALGSFAAAFPKDRSEVLSAFGDNARTNPFARWSRPRDAREAVAADNVLGRLSDDDVPWALDEIFAAASAFVLVVEDAAAPLPHEAASRPAEWWRLQMELAAARTPGRSWRVILGRGGRSQSFDGFGRSHAFAPAA